ncbi:MAG: hypothetical protein K0U24_03655 [Gammaproteobacteria bacterium]|nr:hypothetical protein [Gammaproteobacteria bacterium]MCH9763311.1 hypothetical protein [Gammaproteobacteria bacterium]
MNITDPGLPRRAKALLAKTGLLCVFIFSEVDDVIVLLLCGGDKKTQAKDIKLAKAYLKDPREAARYLDEALETRKSA